MRLIDSGTQVRFTLEHYQWLDHAGLWPRKLSRRDYTGIVVGWPPGKARTPGVVHVTWTRGVAQSTWHFADNLEEVGA